MSGTEFVKLVEKNDHEGETWVFWLQYTGNEEEIDKLDKILRNWAATSKYEIDFTLDLDRRPEDKIDFAVKETPNDGCYNSIHNKIIGTFTCPEDPGLDEMIEDWEDPNISRERLFYKGKIAEYFRA